MIPHRLYVGTIGEGLFRSLDGGQSFRRTCDGMFVECHVRALTVHPRDPRTLYLGSELGVFISRDGADSWTEVAGLMHRRQVWSILVSPHDSNILVVGTCPSQIFASQDGGRTWIEGPAAIRQECPRIIHTRVTTLTADPSDAATVWAGVEIDGLLRSRDAGRHWERLSNHGLSSLDIHALAIVPQQGRPHRLIATTNNDVNLSEDGGETWHPQRVSEVLPWPYFRGLQQQRGRPETLLLGNGDAPPGSVGVIARSIDAGRSWQPTAMPGPANSTVWNFAVHEAAPNLIYASSVSGEVYRSVDGGATWEKLQREFGEIRALAWTP